MYTQRLSSLEFFTYAAFLAVVVGSIASILPGRKPPVRTEPYADDELKAHDSRLPKYFLAGGVFLLLGGIHMVLKNLPWTAEWLARAGYAGHLVRDLSNTHVMIVGGGTLISTGLCWYVLPRIVRRPLSSPGLAQGAFWFTAVGLLVFYIALIANGIAMGRLVSSGWDYEAAKLHMGKAYRVPVGIGAGVMGIGYWCFAANVFLTIFQSRLVRVPKPTRHLWKFLATGAAGLTVGTVQGVIQVQPAHADWLYKAGHAGEWIDPISHAHINLVTGLTMLTAGALFALAPALGGKAPTRRVANFCFWSLLGGSLAFYGVALYLGFHEGRLVVRHGLTPEQAEEATRLHPFLIMGAGIAMMAAFWFLLVTLVRSFRDARGPIRAFVLAGCAALAVGTLQGPVQAFPAVNELLDRGGDAGDVIVNLHAQLNMLAGLMLILMGAALALTPGALAWGGSSRGVTARPPARGDAPWARARPRLPKRGPAAMRPPEVKPRKRRRSIMSAPTRGDGRRAAERRQDARDIEKHGRARRALEMARDELALVRIRRGQALEGLEPDDVVDEKGRRQLIALDDEGLGTARGAPGLEPQEGAQVHEGHEAASQVRHPDQVRGRQGYLRVLVEDHDLARESHFRRVESVAEPDQARARLRRGRRRYRGRRGHLTNCLTMLTSCSGVKGLPRYSSAPWRFPQTRSLSWFLELTSTTGVCRVRASRLMLRRSS